MSIVASSTCAGSPPLLENSAAIFLIAARFQVPICMGCTLYFFDNSAIIISSRIASSATLALKLGEWFFRFVILDHLSHKLIHLNYWSEFPRLPLSCWVGFYYAAFQGISTYKLDFSTIRRDQCSAGCKLGAKFSVGRRLS